MSENEKKPETTEADSSTPDVETGLEEAKPEVESEAKSETTPTEPQATPAKPHRMQEASTSKVPNPEANQQSHSQSQPGKKSALATSLSVIAFLTSLGVAGGGWWLWQQQGQLVQNQNAAQKALSSTVNEQQGKVDSLKGQLAQVQAASQQLQQVLQQQAKQLETAVLPRLDSHNRRLLALGNTSREDWLLAEAEYLLRLAAQRQSIEGVSDSVAALVVSADTILRDVADADLYPVREALAREVAALKLAGSVDRQGLYAKLTAVQEQISLLPEIEVLLPKAKEEIIPAENNESGFVASLHEFAEKMQSHVRLSNSSEGSRFISTDLMPEAKSFAKARMTLLITQAQSALLQSERELYLSALSQINPLVEKHFPVSNQRGWILEEVALLEAKNISPPRVALNGSLNALRAYIERLHKLAPPKNTKPAAVSAVKSQSPANTEKEIAQ
ncbi:MAG: uroporphyrinogen-III C-methyltransferase [Cellvibrionaceae bacterium]